MKVYISGPITGNPNYKTEFGRIEDALKKRGYEVVNPAADEYELGVENKFSNESWVNFIVNDIKLVSECDAICLLPKWYNSPGATIEALTAEKLGKTFLIVNGDKIDTQGVRIFTNFQSY